MQLQSGNNVVVCAAYRPSSCFDSDISMIEHIDSTIEYCIFCIVLYFITLLGHSQTDPKVFLQGAQDE